MNVFLTLCCFQADFFISDPVRSGVGLQRGNNVGFEIRACPKLELRAVRKSNLQGALECTFVETIACYVRNGKTGALFAGGNTGAERTEKGAD